MKEMIKVKIKTWELMEKEFGLFHNDINTPNLMFIQKMEKEMPKDRIIEVYKNEKTLDYIWEVPQCSEYIITDDMIDSIIDKSTKKTISKKIIGLLILATAIYIGVKK